MAAHCRENHRPPLTDTNDSRLHKISNAVWAAHLSWTPAVIPRGRMASQTAPEPVSPYRRRRVYLSNAALFARTVASQSGSCPEGRIEAVGRGFGPAAELPLGACDLKYFGGSAQAGGPACRLEAPPYHFPLDFMV